jgi:flagellar basal body P-ring formation protein FlgA
MTSRSRILSSFTAAALLWTLVPPGSALAQAVVAIRAIRGTSMIGPEDVEVANESDAPGAFHDVDEVIGREAKVTLYPGRPILKGQIGAPAIVERNAMVKMIYADGSLNIVTDGRVLDRGGIGDLIRVMNLSSRQVVTGSVEPDGTIKVAR